MTRRVLITEPEGFSLQGLALLREAGFAPERHTGGTGGFTRILPGVEGLIVRLGIHWTKELLQHGAALRFLATPTTGLDHIDLGAAGAQGIEVLSLKGLEGLEEVSSTAEHTVGLLLCLVRHSCPAHRSVLTGEWNRDAFRGRELRGMVAGIVGLGRLGRQFASLATAFGMRILYYDPQVATAEYERCDTLAELAGRADVVSVHAALDGQSRHLLSADFFAAAKRGQYLINTARGDLIDEEALLAALEQGTLAGAALDVLSGEPEAGQSFHSPVIDYARTHDHLLITPHLGGCTADAMRATEVMIVREVVRRFAGG